MSYKLRIILEYFQPKIGRRIRIFSLGRKNNILIKKKECNFTYPLAISRCLAGINAVIVIPLMTPKFKLSCLMIILTPPWHYSPCHRNLCITPPTEHIEPEGHFVYWKSTSSPGSHPNENRTCRKDLWAAFVLWSVFYFLSFVLFEGLNGVNR